MEGERVRVRAAEMADLPTYLRWVNDPEVTEHLDLEPPMGMEQEEQWFRSMRERGEEVMSIETLDGKLIGNMGILRVSWRDRKALIGIMIGEEEFRWKGYGREALRLLLDYLFDELGMNRVHLEVDAAHQGAVRCYRGLEFRIEGTLRQNRFKRGEYRDQLVMSLLREEWYGGSE